MKLKKIGKVFTSKFVGTGPLSYEKRIYGAAVSQRLRNTGLTNLLCITENFNLSHNGTFSVHRSIFSVSLHGNRVWMLHVILPSHKNSRYALYLSIEQELVLPRQRRVCLDVQRMFPARRTSKEVQRFEILLTVHLSIILVIDQLNALILVL